MSFHNPYQTNWYANYQEEYDQRVKYNDNGNAEMHESGMEKKARSDMNGSGIYPGYDYSDPPNSYHGTSPDMQYMNQMMMNLGNQLEKLNELITQNNQLLQSLHDQKDTKCVQGSGGGAVIVRM